MQRPQLAAGGGRPIRLARPLERLVRIDEAEAVERRVDLLDALEAVPHRLDRRELACPDEPRKLRRGRVAEVEVDHGR